MEDWFRDGTADGFNLMPPVLPAMLEVFIAEIVPVLRRRHLFRTRYAGDMPQTHTGCYDPKCATDASRCRA